MRSGSKGAEQSEGGKELLADVSKVFFSLAMDSKSFLISFL